MLSTEAYLRFLTNRALNGAGQQNALDTAFHWPSKARRAAHAVGQKRTARRRSLAQTGAGAAKSAADSPIDFGGKFPAATTHLLDD